MDLIVGLKFHCGFFEGVSVGDVYGLKERGMNTQNLKKIQMS